ncbi:hypothetical protein Clacol_000121 [Clathrus columnatus]|uniref:Uncharacterized protein n=1 Tax=Clathrus columnatus TaxID=1419009 RepID=A0AAV4ZZV4_9AGAM|nr:hypothetical protein Clacol_000121 [Clathrus columnatus]
MGKISTGVVKCEMDANNPSTQKRSTQEYRGVSGRNLAFGGRKVSNSGNLGTAWLEIRRATAIEVNEVSTVNKKLTITWVASDHPDTGVPYATFIINFVLDESAMNGVMNSPSLSSPGISSITRASIRRSSTEERVVESAIQNLDSSNGDIVESKITPSAVESGISETVVQDSDSDVVQILNGSGAQKRGRSDSQTEDTPDVKRSRVDEAGAPTTSPTLNPQIPEITTPKTPVNDTQLPEVPVDAFTIPKMGLCKIPKIVIPSVPGVFLVGASVEDEIPDRPPPPVPDTPKSEEPTPKTPTQTQTPLPAPEVLVPETPSQTQTSKITVPETPVKNTQIQETQLDLSDDEGDDFESKLAIIEV